MRRLAGTAAFVLTLSAPLWPQPSLSHVQLTVDAKNNEWAATTIQVEPGDMVLVQASGKISVGPYLREVDPDGGPASMNFVGTLDIKVGIGAPQRAGAKGCLFADLAGQIRVRIRDEVRYDDNSGSFTVSLIHIPAALVPRPRVLDAAAGGAPARERR